MQHDCNRHTYLVNHVAFRVPMLILVVAIDLNELLQNSRAAPRAPDSKPGRIVEVTEDSPFVLVVTVLRPEDSRTDGAGEVLYVELLAQSSDVGPS